MKGEILSYCMVLMMYCCTYDRVKNIKIKLKNVIFVNYFLNVVFLVTIPSVGFKFHLINLHTYSEGTVSQIFNLGLSFYFIPKIGKHFEKFVNIIFQMT